MSKTQLYERNKSELEAWYKFRQGCLSYLEIRNRRFILDVFGKFHSPDDLLRYSQITVVTNHHQFSKGRELMRRNIAFVCNSTAINVIGNSLDGFVRRLVEATTLSEKLIAMLRVASDLDSAFPKAESRKQQHELFYAKFGRWPDEVEDEAYSMSEYLGSFEFLTVRNIEDLLPVIDSNMHLVPPENLSDQERRLQNVMQKVADNLVESIHKHGSSFMSEEDRFINKYRFAPRLWGLKKSRKIIIGRSAFASAWTDGQSFIAINENLIGKLISTYTDDKYMEKASITIHAIIYYMFIWRDLHWLGFDLEERILAQYCRLVSEPAFMQQSINELVSVIVNENQLTPGRALRKNLFKGFGDFLRMTQDRPSSAADAPEHYLIHQQLDKGRTYGKRQLLF